MDDGGFDICDIEDGGFDIDDGDDDGNTDDLSGGVNGYNSIVVEGSGGVEIDKSIVDNNGLPLKK